MNRPLLVVLICVFLSTTQTVRATALRCETDSECPKPLVCRLICTRTCRSACVRLKPTQQVIFDNTPLQIASYESEPFTTTSTVEPEPFTTMSSFFMEEEHVDTTTPLVSNEMQIESKKPLTSKNMDQRDEIAIEPIHRIPLRRIHHRQHDISRIPQQFPLGGEIPRGPPSPGPRLQTRVPPASLGVNENSVIEEFVEPPSRSKIVLPNGPPSPPPEIIQIAVPSVSPIGRGKSIKPSPSQLVTLPPWRKALPPVDVPVNHLSFRGQVESVHPLKPPGIPRKPIKVPCPPPPICGQNCGISIDEHGCQSCTCLWLSALCRYDHDCPHPSQFCDFGRCECRAGFIHSPIHSGVCEWLIADSPPHAPPPHGNFHLNAVKSRPATPTKGYKSRPRRSELAVEKPNHEIRLQWPGPSNQTILVFPP